VLISALMAYYRMAITWKILYAVPILVILLAFSTAVALLLSAVQVRWRDVGMALPLLLQVWMFATPVVYPMGSVPAAVRRIYVLNPVAVLIDGFRRVTLHGESPDFALLGIATAITLLSLIVAYAVFKNLEATMADFI
jgi:lipopolysaccharide transport system permease protein